MLKELIDILLESKTHQVVFSMLVFAIIGTIIIHIIGKKMNKSKKLDQEKIFDLARARNCSEYDIFVRAGENWNFSEQKIAEDFKSYLSSNVLPHYVSSYVRDQEETNE